jgi:glycosyltransferase involved in cell wall biosynthesis
MSKKPKINIYSDYAEDNRKSMDIYANAIYNNFPQPKSLEIFLYRPIKSDWIKFIPKTFNLGTRISRYINYPLALLSERDGFSHIIDQTYAHLALTLNPDKCIVTVHDLIPILAWKGLIPSIHHTRRPFLFEYSAYFLKKVKKIIAVSHSTKLDLIRVFGIPEGKIIVVHNGVDSIFKQLNSEKLDEKYANLIKDGVFNVLIIGNNFYKNNKSALAAIELFESRYSCAVQVICLGNNLLRFQEDCKNVKLSIKPIFLMNISAEELVDLYNICDCLLFPSLYEGFGLPPLEAMACGLPVITSNLGALKEVVGSAAVIVEPTDIDGIATHLYRVFTEPYFRNDLILRGLKRVKEFSWSVASRKILNIYEETWKT